MKRAGEIGRGDIGSRWQRQQQTKMETARYSGANGREGQGFWRDGDDRLFPIVRQQGHLYLPLVLTIDRAARRGMYRPNRTLTRTSKLPKVCYGLCLCRRMMHAIPNRLPEESIPVPKMGRSPTEYCMAARRCKTELSTNLWASHLYITPSAVLVHHEPDHSLLR